VHGQARHRCQRHSPRAAWVRPGGCESAAGARSSPTPTFYMDRSTLQQVTAGVPRCSLKRSFRPPESRWEPLSGPIQACLRAGWQPDHHGIVTLRAGVHAIPEQIFAQSSPFAAAMAISPIQRSRIGWIESLDLRHRLLRVPACRACVKRVALRLELHLGHGQFPCGRSRSKQNGELLPAHCEFFAIDRLAHAHIGPDWMTRQVVSDSQVFSGSCLSWRSFGRRPWRWAKGPPFESAASCPTSPISRHAKPA
jgi:hypothetical protein